MRETSTHSGSLWRRLINETSSPNYRISTESTNSTLKGAYITACLLAVYCYSLRLISSNLLKTEIARLQQPPSLERIPSYPEFRIPNSHAVLASDPGPSAPLPADDGSSHTNRRESHPNLTPSGVRQRMQCSHANSTCGRNDKFPGLGSHDAGLERDELNLTKELELPRRPVRPWQPPRIRQAQVVAP